MISSTGDKHPEKTNPPQQLYKILLSPNLRRLKYQSAAVYLEKHRMVLITIQLREAFPDNKPEFDPRLYRADSRGRSRFTYRKIQIGVKSVLSPQLFFIYLGGREA